LSMSSLSSRLMNRRRTHRLGHAENEQSHSYLLEPGDEVGEPQPFAALKSNRGIAWHLPRFVEVSSKKHFAIRGIAREPRNLGFASPIGRWKRKVPKARCGPCQFHCNFGRPRRLLLHIDHAALLLFPAVRVLQEEPLPGCDHVS